MRTFALAWMCLWALGGFMVIAASLLRCRKCRGWHESKEEDEKCGTENMNEPKPMKETSQCQT